MSRFKIPTVLSLMALLAMVLACPRLEAETPPAAPERIRQIRLPKESRELLEKGGVFIFYDPVCPICAEYFPTIEGLQSRFSKQPFYLVMKSDDAVVATEFAEKYKPHSEILIDKSGELQSNLNAQVTPQVFLVKSGKTIYSGRIDDRYESIGHRRTVIRTRDLEDALKASAEGQIISQRETKPVGCFLEQIKKSRSKAGT